MMGFALLYPSYELAWPGYPVGWVERSETHRTATIGKRRTWRR